MKSITSFIRNQKNNYKYIEKYDISIKSNVQLDNSNIRFGKNVMLYSGVQIWGTGHITIEDNVAIGKNTIIFANQDMIIGANTLIAAQCYIIDSDHESLKTELIRKQPLASKPISIGSDVWIGAGSIILGGACIKDGSIVGALSMVNRTTNPYSINVGSPAKELRQRM